VPESLDDCRSLRALFRNGHTPAGSQQKLDGIGQMFFRDVMIAPFDAE